MNLDSIDALLKTFIALCSATALVLGAMKTYEMAKNLKKPPVTSYTELESRVVTLEKADAERSKEVSKLRNQVYRLSGVLTREVGTVVAWYRTGKLEPHPDREIRIINELITEIQEDMRTS